MSARWITAPDPAAAAEACSQFVLNILEEALSGAEFATFAVSGVTSPKLLFAQLARAKFPWDRVHLFWVDERCVCPTDSASNYKLAEELLIRSAQIPQSHVHRIWGELAPQAAAERYEGEIRDFFGLEEGEFPHFDLVH